MRGRPADAMVPRVPEVAEELKRLGGHAWYLWCERLGMMLENRPASPEAERTALWAVKDLLK